MKKRLLFGKVMMWALGQEELKAECWAVVSAMRGLDEEENVSRNESLKWNFTCPLRRWARGQEERYDETFGGPFYPALGIGGIPDTKELSAIYDRLVDAATMRPVSMHWSDHMAQALKAAVAIQEVYEARRRNHQSRWNEKNRQKEGE